MQNKTARPANQLHIVSLKIITMYLSTWYLRLIHILIIVFFLFCKLCKINNKIYNKYFLLYHDMRLSNRLCMSTDFLKKRGGSNIANKHFVEYFCSFVLHQYYKTSHHHIVVQYCFSLRISSFGSHTYRLILLDYIRFKIQNLSFISDYTTQN